MGKGERSRTENQAHNFSGRQEENRSRSAREMGETRGGKLRGRIYNQPKFGLFSSADSSILAVTLCFKVVESLKLIQRDRPVTGVHS